MALIINLSVVVAIIGLWLSARYWRRTAGKALFNHAIACYKKEDREELARKAVMAGNRPAGLLYALNSPELFDKARPMRLLGLGRIRLVFAGYYFSQRYADWLREDQTDFVQEVYDFKEGRDDCRKYFSKAFEVLSPEGSVTAMFMPCSTASRYYRRFSRIASYLETVGCAESGLELVWITESRECKHTAEHRTKVDTNNYAMSARLQGRRVVVVDDLMTTGSSLEEYARNLERAGATVCGAVFLARTFEVPSLAKVRRKAWMCHLKRLLFRK